MKEEEKTRWSQNKNDKREKQNKDQTNKNAEENHEKMINS